MIVVAYGANLDSRYGDPVQTFEIARQMLGDTHIKLIKSSSLYDTSPVGTENEIQPWYTNAVMQVETDQTPYELLNTLLNVECEIGRTRDKRNEPRVIDLDLIAYHNEIINDDHLILPHPRMHERKFVLHPLQELDEQWRHPVFNTEIASLIAVLPDKQKIRKIR